MSKRIIAISAVVAATACVVACVLIWQLLVHTQENHQRLLDQLSTINQDREDANTELMAALDRKGPDWQPLSIRLVDEEGEPVRDDVTVRGTTASGGEISESAETDEEGVADFGRLPPGEYEAHYFVEDLNVGSSTEFLLGPGRPNEFEITCPTEPPGEFTIAFDIEPPEPLAEIPLYYLAPLDYESRMFNGQSWRVGGRHDEPVLVLDTAGNILGQAAYDDVTTRKRDGITITTNYVRELPADFELQPVEDLRAYEFDVELWPYVEDPADERQGDERPELKRLGAALRGLPEQQPAPGEIHTVQVSPPFSGDNAQFWDAVINDLSRIDKYEGRFAGVAEQTDEVLEEQTDEVLEPPDPE